MKVRSCMAAACAALIGGTTIAAHAQSWPTKPIRLIVPYPAGGPIDTIARMLVPTLQKELGQTIVVDNRSGASGLVGIQTAVQAPADGYTFGFGVLGVLAVQPHVIRMPFKPEDVGYVTLATQSPHVIAVNPAAGYADLKSIVEAAKRSPGKLNYGSPGTGSSTHLDGELLAAAAKIELVHVPYKGGAAVVTALLGNEVQLIAAEISAAMPLQPRVKIATVMSMKRVAQLPDVPATAELGYSDVVASSIYGIVGPAKVPAPISEGFRKAVVTALNQPDVKQLLNAQGQTVTPSTAAEYKALMASESVKWGAIIKSRNIKFE